MRLQSILLPAGDPIYEASDSADRGMFFRAAGGELIADGGETVLSAGCEVSFDTCFGAFFTQKWLRYTALSTLWAEVTLSGGAAVSCFRAFRAADGTMCAERCASAETAAADVKRRVRLNIPQLQPESMYYIVISAVTEVRITDACFGCDDDDDADMVNISAAICTYKREQYVENTLAVIDSGVFRNGNSELSGHLNVYIADNGQTLEAGRLENELVHIFPNRNCGGTGGFTRCMLEIMDREPDCTHIMLMDDDIAFPVRTLEITYSFLRLLRPEHKDISVGGALWRSDVKWLQYEAGAVWDGCRITPRGQDVDLRSAEQLLDNSVRIELIDYNGWWCTCVPTARIREVGYPLPLFLHRDDIEYGLRLKGRFVIPDGVGVWHESFERKLSGASEYYDLRNMLIVNSIHRKQFSRSDYISFVRKWYLRNLFSHRYKYILMNLAAVRDAIRGIDSFIATDPVALHQRVMQMNYRLSDAAELAREIGLGDFDRQYSEQLAERFSPPSAAAGISPVKKSLYSILTVAAKGGLWLPGKKEPMLAVHPTPIWKFFASGTILHADSNGRGYVTRRNREEIKQCRELYRETVRLLTSWYEIECSEYRSRWKELVSEEFWRKYLGITK